MTRAGARRGFAASGWTGPASLALVLLGWEAVCIGFGIPDIVIPTPSAIGASLWYGFASGVYVTHGLVTAVEALLGLVLAVLTGVALGTVIAEIRLVEKAVYPLVVAFQAMPKVALAPLMIVWFGYGIGSKVLVAASIAFFPILVSTVAGLKSCDEGKLDLMRALGAGRWQTFRLVRLPNALPFVFGGLNVAAAFVVLGAVVGEFLGAKEGLGTLILIANGNLDVAQVFAVLVMLGSFGFLAYLAIRAAQRRLLRWAPVEALSGP